MQKGLTLDEIEQFVEVNKYALGDNPITSSRCIDGRYKKDKQLPGLAKPGADVGDLMVLFSANDVYSLGLTNEEIITNYIKAIGGSEHFYSHTDLHHQNEKDMFFGCGHFNHSFHNPESFALSTDSVGCILHALEENKKSINHVVLDGEHCESAIIVVKGNTYSVYPSYNPVGEKNKVFPYLTQIFIYHRTLDNLRRRQIVEAFLPFVKLENITSDYLYEVLSQTADDQLLEIIATLAPNLPLYEVEFAQNGKFEIVLS